MSEHGKCWLPEHEGGFFTYGTTHTMKFGPGNIDTSEGSSILAADYLFEQICFNLITNSDAGLKRKFINPSGVYARELIKLGLITWTASKLLGLKYSAPVYVTSIDKDLNLIAKDLGFMKEIVYINSGTDFREEKFQVPDISKLYLFDDKDKVDVYADKLGEFPMDIHMIPVTKYILNSYNFNLEINFPVPLIDIQIKVGLGAII